MPPSVSPTLKLPTHTGVPADRGDYLYGDNQALFLATRASLDTLAEYQAASTEAVTGIFLEHLRTDPWEALVQLLPADCPRLRRLRDHCVYTDVFTGRRTPSLLPLVLFTTTPQAYLRDNGVSAWRLEMACEQGESLAQSFAELQDTESFSSVVRLRRVSQVLIGTGYTVGTLPSDGDAQLHWQFIEMTNGDWLVLAGYEWFNK